MFLDCWRNLEKFRACTCTGTCNLYTEKTQLGFGPGPSHSKAEVLTTAPSCSSHEDSKIQNLEQNKYWKKERKHLSDVPVHDSLKPYEAIVCKEDQIFTKLILWSMLCSRNPFRLIKPTLEMEFFFLYLNWYSNIHGFYFKNCMTHWL